MLKITDLKKPAPCGWCYLAVRTDQYRFDGKYFCRASHKDLYVVQKSHERLMEMQKEASKLPRPDIRL